MAGLGAGVGAEALAGRVQGRLDRLGLAAEAAGRAAGLADDFLPRGG